MTIKGKLEKFRIHMPLINVLCNPGIKDRHWELMSEQVGAVTVVITVVKLFTLLTCLLSMQGGRCKYLQLMSEQVREVTVMITVVKLFILLTCLQTMQGGLL